MGAYLDTPISQVQSDKSNCHLRHHMPLACRHVASCLQCDCRLTGLRQIATDAKYRASYDVNALSVLYQD